MNPINIIRDWLAKAVVSNIKPIFESYASFGVSHFTKQDWYYGIVFSCIDAIATNVASTDIYLAREKNQQQQVIDEHPAIRLLKRPNSFQTGKDLMYIVSSHIDAHGAAYLYAVASATGQITELWALDPQRVTTVTDNNQFISGYKYRNPRGQLIDLSIKEVIPILRPNPYKQQEGISTIDMARRTIEADLQAQEFNKNFFKNGANPAGILSTPGELSQGSRERIREEFTRRYEGVKNSYKTLILEGGLAYTPVQATQKDMDFVSSRQMSRDEILAIFKVPKTILAITDDVNRANAETSDYVFASRVVLPRLQMICEKLTVFYLPLFTNTQGMVIDFVNPVPEDKELELKTYQAGINNWLTANDIRLQEGMDTIEGMDTLFYEMSKIPVGGSEPSGNQTESIDRVQFKKLSSKARYYVMAQRIYVERQIKLMSPAIKQSIFAFIQKVSQQSTKQIEVSANIKGINDVSSILIPSASDFGIDVSDVVSDYGKQSIDKASQLISNNFGIESVKPTASIKWLKDHSNDTGKASARTIVERSREIIAQNLANETTDIETIKQNLISKLKLESDYQAERIARTEVATAYQHGAKEQIAKSDIIDKVVWIVSQPNDPDCLAYAGVIADKNDTPWDDDEPPVHPNCMCDVAPYL